MIRSFGCKDTEKIFSGERQTRFPADVISTARRKLDMIHAALTIQSLLAPPANRLEKLKGGRQGQWSIRINDQWRVCFRWDAPNADDVEIVDYH